MYIFTENDYIYDWISCLLPNQIYFGPFPNQLMIDSLLKENFNLIVDLTKNEENYENKNEYDKSSCLDQYISFPIYDGKVPECEIKYCSFILYLKKCVLENKKIYIHCRGGHGRSSMVCVSLLFTLTQESDFKKTIDTVNERHNERIVLRNRWKKRKSPFNYGQYLFLSKIHKNIYINVYSTNKYYFWLFYRETFREKCESEYPSLYDFFELSLLSEKEKYEEIYSYLYKKLTENKKIEFRLMLTYLKNFVISDCDNKDFCTIYNKILGNIRENVFEKV